MVGNLVCPYHTWTYALDGRLIFAAHMGEDFDPSGRSLKPVHLRSVAGLLFICLAEDPPADIEDMAATMTPYLAPHDLPNTKIAKATDLVEHGNWKITMENNRECYHCSANHPELTVSIFAYGFGFSPLTLDDTETAQAHRYQALVADSHRKWEAAGTPSREVEHLADRITGFRTERLPMDQAGESQTLDTRVACRKPLGQINDPRLGGLSFWTQPNSWHHFMSDHVVTFSAIPLGPDRTLLRTKWLVHKDAVEGADYDLDNLTTVWEATNRQDAHLVGLAQAGASSPAYEPGPYSPYTEGLVEKGCLWYLDRLSAGLDA
jgi:Rieske 2Fe-2S family protein